MELVSCDLCQSAEHKPLREYSRLARVVPPEQYVSCIRCGLIYRTPRFAVRKEDEYNDPAYYKEYMEKSAMAGGNEDISPALVDRLRYLGHLYPRRGRLLEIGCAMGHFLHRARTDGWEVEGIEVSTWSSAEARRRYGLTVHTGTLETIWLPQATYDVVHMNHVLEHLPSPTVALEIIRKLLKPGGHLVLEVPNEFGDLFGLVRGWLGRPPAPYEVPSPHLYIFRPKTLKALAHKAGYRVVRLRSYRNDRAPESRFPLGSLVKNSLYGLEEWLTRGPLLELVLTHP